MSTAQTNGSATQENLAESALDCPSRRSFLKNAVGGALTMMWALEGCRSAPEAESPTPTIADDQPADELPAANREDATSERSATSGTTLRVAFAGMPLQFDPAVITANSAKQVAFTVYEGLVWLDHELTVQPALATAWEQSADLLSWTFTLRQDVLFHHATPFTAQDVVYTFERLLDPTVGSPMRSVLSFVERVEVVEDGTPTGAVRFILASANVELPLLCGTPQSLIVPHDYDMLMLAGTPSGTGAFQVEKMIPGQEIVLVRNESHWAVDEYSLQAVHYTFMASLEERAAALRAGEITLLPDISSSDIALFQDDDNITIVESPSGAYQTVVMQATEAPFDDIRVRQALKLCIDRATIQRELLGGRGEIGYDQPVASISPFHADLTVPQRDIEQARQLLLDAGYPDGLQLDLITAALDPGMVRLAYLVQEMAAPAGFEIRPTEVPADVYWSSYWMQVPFHIGSWNFRPSIDETFSIAYHSNSLWNESRWSDEELDALLDQARSEPDPEQRKVLYQQAQEIVMTRGAVMIPVFRSVLTAIRGTVKNFVPHPTGWLDLRGVALVEPT